MNMQISPISTHSHQLRDPCVDNHTFTWWRQKHQWFQTALLRL